MSTFVLFIGGYQSTWIDIRRWMASAMHDNPSVIFDGYPYPDIRSAKAADAIAAFHSMGEAIKKVKDSQHDTKFIVGHSSGCAIANKIDASLDDYTTITLVALDGFSPSNAQLERTTTQVWSAESVHGKSLHHDDMLDRVEDYNKNATHKQKVQMFTAARNCSTKFALHFSLVNLSANNDTVGVITDGYNKCKANLCWLS